MSLALSVPAIDPKYLNNPPQTHHPEQTTLSAANASLQEAGRSAFAIDALTNTRKPLIVTEEYSLNVVPLPRQLCLPESQTNPIFIEKIISNFKLEYLLWEGI